MMSKTALLTGPSGNLGPIWQETLEEMGYEVIGWGMPGIDLSSQAEIEKAASNIEETPSVIVNSAAIDNPPGSEASFFGNLEEILRVNLIAPCLIARQFIPRMVTHGGGLIVNIGSIMGYIGADWRNYPLQFEKPLGYNLSKAALIQLSRSITVQYGQYGVRSVTIAFGPYDGGKLTDEFKGKFLKNVPLGRTISRESFKATLRFAIECPEAAGQGYLVDGGYCAW